MSIFTVLDEINAAWEKDQAMKAEYAYYKEASKPDHPDHHALFVDPAGKYHDHGYDAYDSYEDEWYGPAPHPFTYGPPESEFDKVVDRCFRVVSYNLRDTPEFFAEWAKNPDKDGMLGFLRAIVLADNSRFSVISHFFGNEDTSMMFADVDFPKDKEWHHIKWGTNAYGFETYKGGDVHHLHEYLNKANRVLNSNGMPTGEVKNETLDLLAKEWEKRTGRGRNPELLEMMIRSFYENMTPVAYAVLHQTMMMVHTHILAAHGPLDETPPLLREDIAYKYVQYEHYIGRKHDRVEYELEASICRDNARFGSCEPVWSVSGYTYWPTSGDFRMTTGQLWYGYKGGFYPITPDYACMNAETTEIYKKIAFRVFSAISDGFME